MALVKNGALATDTTGESETLTLSVVQAVASSEDDSANTDSTTQIASAFYGADASGNPIAADVSADGQSLKLKSLHGVNSLEVNFVSASASAATVQLTQNGTVLLEAEMDGHTGSGTLMIEGQ